MPAELIALILLWLLPVAVLVATSHFAPTWVGRATGISLGAVISPALAGLYGLYFVGPVVALVGLVAFPLAYLHGAPGYSLSMALGIVPPGIVVVGYQRVYIELLNGTVWAVVYGVLGWLIDLFRARRTRLHAHLNAV